jgi:ABC-type transport system substrate-binding protein
MAGCEGPPARDKPWRHAPDAGVPPVSAAIAPVLAGEEARLRALAARGDTLTVWLDADPRSLNPLAAPTIWTLRIASDTVFEALVRYRPGEGDGRPGDYEPRLARRWQVGAGGREIVFELQPTVRLHDGRALSAVDVQRSIDAARRASTGRDASSGRGGPLAAALADVDGVDLIGPRSLRVRLSRPNAHVLRALAEVPIVVAARPAASAPAKATAAGTGGDVPAAGKVVAGAEGPAGAAPTTASTAASAQPSATDGSGSGAAASSGAAGGPASATAGAAASSGAAGSPAIAVGGAAADPPEPWGPGALASGAAVKVGLLHPKPRPLPPLTPPAEPWVADVVGTGPYRIASWRDGTVTLDRFDDHWGDKPAFAHIVFRYEPDAALALRRARGGEIDVVPALIREHRSEQGRAPGSSASLAPLRLRPPVLRYLSLNTRRPPFDDSRVRCALGRLLDRASLVSADKHLSRPAGGPIWSGGPGDGPAMEVPPFDRAGASALLDQAGWRDEDGDGLRTRDGKRLLLTVLVSDRPDDQRDRVVESLRAAGFVIDARVGSTAVLDNRLRDGRFDVAFVEWSAVPGEDLAPLFGTGGALNFGGFSDPRIDEALAGLRGAWQADARWDGMGRLGALLAETCPVVPLVAPEPHGLISRRLRGATIAAGWLSLRGASLAPPDEPR